ncbi:hypothetical protein B0F90DRAFT_1642808 [Multifurca ochricompacta]|uniref:YCII-related domain-containing protein n=1 Tax=Multifurca ochricompacta TaxID=376703 RepID=A0AAD4QGH5_9AGAM|nr:hypothetical protein B0F90DRAFT_1642808 [Multifurca ochricompacta]
MSSSLSRKHLFAVYAPDYEDPESLDRRLSVREKHLQGADGLRESGTLKFGGALLAPEFTNESGRKKMVGTIMFLEAENIEEARKFVESDIYHTSGVWDKEKLVVLPFVTAIPWKST